VIFIVFGIVSSVVTVRENSESWRAIAPRRRWGRCRATQVCQKSSGVLVSHGSLAYLALLLKRRIKGGSGWDRDVARGGGGEDAGCGIGGKTSANHLCRLRMGCKSRDGKGIVGTSV
jgi:hypothetical protein